MVGFRGYLALKWRAGDAADSITVLVPGDTIVDYGAQDQNAIPKILSHFDESPDVDILSVLDGGIDDDMRKSLEKSTYFSTARCGGF